MTEPQLLFLGLDAMRIGLALFCANLLFLRRTDREVYWPLGAFFLAEAITTLPLLAEHGGLQVAAGDPVLLLAHLTVPFDMTMAPLFWLYVRGLTSAGRLGDIRYKALHLLPVFGGLCLAALLVALPQEVMAAFIREEMPDHWMAGAVLFAAWALGLVFYGQVALYLGLSLRLLALYRSQLKTLFASTEERELRWLWWLAAVAGSFLIFNLVDFLSQLFGVGLAPEWAPAMAYIDHVLLTGLTWIIALWGLRQKPGLSRAPVSEGRAALQSAASEMPKYERSALGPQQARRLAAKIDSAMRQDLLYRDPNLSLWDLSRHIGVSSNYLSQTLNETLGHSFFDYVNRWRVTEAAHRLDHSEETVLAIAYDVGFNSKSAFYKAFRRHVGLTPTAWRQRPAQSALTLEDLAVPQPG